MWPTKVHSCTEMPLIMRVMKLKVRKSSKRGDVCRSSSRSLKNLKNHLKPELNFCQFLTLLDFFVCVRSSEERVSEAGLKFFKTFGGSNKKQNPKAFPPKFSTVSKLCEKPFLSFTAPRELTFSS